VWGVGSSGGDNYAQATITEDYVLTITGGSGSAFAEPLLYVTGQATNDASAGALASLGQCHVNTIDGNNPGCQWDSVAFVFDTPQVVTLFLDAGAAADSISPLVTSESTITGFEFFDVNDQPLSGISYTFAPVDQSTPEPGTSLLTAMACAALIAFGCRRQRRSRGGNCIIIAPIWQKLPNTYLLASAPSQCTSRYPAAPATSTS
jgi:hypothetical protein